MTDDKSNYCGSGKLFIIVVFGNTVQKSVNQNSIVSTEHKITNSRTDFHLPICTVELCSIKVELVVLPTPPLQTRIL